MSYLGQDDRDPYNPRNNITIGVIIAMLVGGGYLLWNFRDAMFSGSKGGNNARLERELKMGADLVNRTAPQRVDEVTTLTGARVSGHEFTYLYSLNQEIPAEVLPTASAQIERDIRPRLCANASLRRILEMGGTISAEYRDPSGDRVRVTIRTCAGR